LIETDIRGTLENSPQIYTIFGEHHTLITTVVIMHNMQICIENVHYSCKHTLLPLLHTQGYFM